MTYKFPEFVEEIVNPVVGEISPSYTIGHSEATVLVELLAAGNSYTVTLTGFDNTFLWKDEDVIAWVNIKLATKLVPE